MLSTHQGFAEWILIDVSSVVQFTLIFNTGVPVLHE